MGLSQCLLHTSSRLLRKQVVLLLLFHVNCLFSLQQPSCHEGDSSALLQFKDSFVIDKSASTYDGAYPKVLSWKSAGGGNSNCCSWDGVECEEKTGHVIGLDLSSSCLYGSINSTSSLFRLVHLQRLNLSDNNFNHSQIPTSIRNFPSLTQLDLSASVFSGQVPSEVSQLSKLSSLNLCCNLDRFSEDRLLKLEASNLRRLVQNLTSLEELSLSFINISSTVPDSVANLSSLTSLTLKACDLFGQFPVRIFKLPNLQVLSVRYNQDLTGYIPEFNRSSPLIVLKVAFTRFSGNIPSAIGKLDSLQELDVAQCNFSKGLVPSALGNLRQLTYLDISANKFGGPIPDSLANLTKLTVFRVSSSQLTGPIPSWLGNFSKLVYLDFAYNRLSGSIPVSFFNLRNLEILYLPLNNLSGIVEFQMFQKLQNLYELHLSGNNLEFVTGPEPKFLNASTLQQFTFLGLSSCNLKEFPYFLRYQENLERLEMSGNQIHGLVPRWMWNMSTKSLQFLSISGNLLSGFEQPPVVLPWVKLHEFQFSGNMIQGPLPNPPADVQSYDASNNQLTGELSLWFCNLTSLKFLELSNNKLSGMLPQCLGNFSDHLQVLNLRNNSFHGVLPQTYSKKSNLTMLDVSHNQLEGKVPRSLANCLMLEFVVLSNNQFNDIFPIWLGTLPELKLLALRHNRFYGVVRQSEKNLNFSKLRILDLSHNNFTGEVPYVFPNIVVNQSTYMKVEVAFDTNSGTAVDNILYSITIAIKGLELYYPKIQEDLAAIDLSGNKFAGKIPEFIGNLKGLRSLNISENTLTGGIPLSFVNLTMLESLDLSQNKLSGQIPNQLAQLTFLSKFNVSHNNLTGPIPLGNQFTTFDITSFEGNPGLCGDPLPKCGNAGPPVRTSTKEEKDPIFEFDWKFVLAGCGSGLVVGVVLSDFVITRKPELFLKIVGMIKEMISKR